MTLSAAFDDNGQGCWRRIGVMGTRTCPELQVHVHCRHCPVYAAAAQQTLHRPVGADYRDGWAQALSRPEAALLAVEESAMVFRLGAEWLALPMALAAGVAPLAPVHRLPHRTRGGLLGIVNVGGRLLPAVSPAHLLDQGGEAMPAPPVHGRHAFPRLLVAASGGHRFALQVDEIHGVLRYAGSAVRPPAATVGRVAPTLLAGVIDTGQFQAGLLDAAALAARLEGLLR